MARRPATPRPTPRPTQPQRHAPRASNVMATALVAALVWLGGFSIWFFLAALQNNGTFNRLTLALLLPDLSSLATESETASVGTFFAQRADIASVALLILVGTACLGGLCLRLVTCRADVLDDLDRFERLVCACGLGLAAWSLVTLGCGLAGGLSQPLFAGVLLAACIAEALLAFREARRKRHRERRHFEMPGRRVLILCLAMIAPFVLLAALGAMLPPVDFDVKEYHLGGPKEWFLDGRIHFLPHNVYTSFPALTEMLSLSAMVIRGDWYRGALAGQVVLWFFLPLTAATVFVIARRLFSTTAGLCGAVIYATTPWTYRIAVIAYAEGGLTCFLALSLFAAVMTIERWRKGKPASRLVLLAGLFAGSGMACKYPGVVQVVIPVGVGLLVTAIIQRRAGTVSPPSVWRTGLLYSLGVLLAVGPWLVKNVVETGNPVYPLLWTVFGGQDWNAELNAKWNAAHSPPHYDPVSFFQEMANVAVRSDWQSLLVFGLAPLAFLAPSRRAVGAVWCYLAFLYGSWWLLTHRIDRFWVPLLPVACVLAGAGATWAAHLPHRLDDAEQGLSLQTIWRWIAYGAACCGIAFNLGVISTALSGNPRYFDDLDVVAKRVATPGLAILNEQLPAGSKVLLVGEAEIFDARFPVIYNTVFDRNIFEDWTAADASNRNDSSMRSAGELRTTFREQGITHVFVNWREILRYRTTYGFTPFVVPERFAQLRQAGVLGAPQTIQQSLFASLNPSEQQEVERRFPQLIHGAGETQFIVASELYRVTTAAPVAP